MGCAANNDGQYLLLFGAGSAQRERVLVAALRAFDGPVATIARSPAVRGAKFFDHVLVGDFSDPDDALRAVLDFERRTGMAPAAVVPCWDAGLVPGLAIAEHYGLPYLTRAAVEDSSINKDRMKDRLLAAGVATPRFIQVDGMTAVRKAIAELGIPCVIKPSAFGGSLGVRLIEDERGAEEAYAYTRRIIDENAAVFTVKNFQIQVEEFCALTDEVSVEVLNHHDRRTVLAVTDKTLGPKPFFAEVGHRVPSIYAGREDVLDLALRACEAIGMDHGVAHVEVKVEDGMPPQIMEVGARTAGGGIPDLVERSYGISVYELHIRSYLEQLDGELPGLPALKSAGLAAVAVLKAAPGRIEEVTAAPSLDEAVATYEVLAIPGKASSASQANYLDREGYVECFWPDAAPESVPARAHVEIADRMSGQIFTVSQQ
jgi:formate-dependent phosphoribosylglycinamide formyltransferase (GAR transformylase)